MSLKSYLLLTFIVWLILGGFPVESQEAKGYHPFQGRRTAWYFNEMDGRVATGLQGPFLNQFDCLQQAQREQTATAGDCYERETVEYFRWRQNQVKAWVLPVRTGEQSEHLIFANRQTCHQVAESGFYYTPTGAKARQRPDLQTCIQTTIFFDEVDNRYAYLEEHPLPQTPYPQRYKAWSLVVEEGHYRKLLQFRNQQQCEQVARDGKYFSFLPRAMFSMMRVVYEIP